MKIRALLVFVGAVSCLAVAACSSNNDTGTGGAGTTGTGGGTTTATGTGGSTTTATGTGGSGTTTGAGGGATTGAGGGGACSTCAEIATQGADPATACPGSAELFNAVAMCVCDPNAGCGTQCGDNLCAQMDSSADCDTCYQDPNGPCAAQVGACAADTGGQ